MSVKNRIRRGLHQNADINTCFSKTNARKIQMDLIRRVWAHTSPRRLAKTKAAGDGLISSMETLKEKNYPKIFLIRLDYTGVKWVGT